MSSTCSVGGTPQRRTSLSEPINTGARVPAAADAYQGISGSIDNPTAKQGVKLKPPRPKTPPPAAEANFGNPWFTEIQINNEKYEITLVVDGIDIIEQNKNNPAVLNELRRSCVAIAKRVQCTQPNFQGIEVPRDGDITVTLPTGTTKLSTQTKNDVTAIQQKIWETIDDALPPQRSVGSPASISIHSEKDRASKKKFFRGFKIFFGHKAKPAKSSRTNAHTKIRGIDCRKTGPDGDHAFHALCNAVRMAKGKQPKTTGTFIDDKKWRIATKNVDQKILLSNDKDEKNVVDILKAIDRKHSVVVLPNAAQLMVDGRVHDKYRNDIKKLNQGPGPHVAIVDVSTDGDKRHWVAVKFGLHVIEIADSTNEEPSEQTKEYIERIDRLRKNPAEFGTSTVLDKPRTSSVPTPNIALYNELKKRLQNSTGTSENVDQKPPTQAVEADLAGGRTNDNGEDNAGAAADSTNGEKQDADPLDDTVDVPLDADVEQAVVDDIIKTFDDSRKGGNVEPNDELKRAALELRWLMRTNDSDNLYEKICKKNPDIKPLIDKTFQSLLDKTVDTVMNCIAQKNIKKAKKLLGEWESTKIDYYDQLFRFRANDKEKIRLFYEQMGEKLPEFLQSGSGASGQDARI